jgi:hypothetical protein
MSNKEKILELIDDCRAELQIHGDYILDVIEGFDEEMLRRSEEDDDRMKLIKSWRKKYNISKEDIKAYLKLIGKRREINTEEDELELPDYNPKEKLGGWVDWFIDEHFEPLVNEVNELIKETKQ